MKVLCRATMALSKVNNPNFWVIFHPNSVKIKVHKYILYKMLSIALIFFLYNSDFCH